MLKRTWQKYKEPFFFFAILLGGLFARILFIENQGLSNDELSAWARAELPWSSFFEVQVKVGDMHPFLYQFIFKLWLEVFGASDWGIRSLSLVFYVLNFTLLFKIAKDYFGISTAIWTTVFFAFSGFLIVNQSTSRPYNSALFFILATLWFSLKWIRQEKLSIFELVLLSTSIAGAVLSHYFAGLVAALIGLVLFFYLSKSNTRRWIGVVLLSFCLFLPHFSITWYQLNQGGLGWLDAPTWTWLFDFLTLLLQGNSWWGLLFILLAFILIWKPGALDKKQTFLGWTLAVIILVSWGVSIGFTPIIRELVFQFIWPFIALFVFSFLERKKPQERAYLSFIPLMFILSLMGYPLLERQHYGEFEGLVQQERNFERKGGGLIIENAINPKYLSFYSGVTRASIVDDWADQNTPAILAEEIRNSNEKRALYAWTNNINLPIFWEIFRQKYPHRMFAKNYFNSGVVAFSEKEGSLFNSQKVSSNFAKNVNGNTEFLYEQKVPVAELLKKSSETNYFVVDLQLNDTVDEGVYLVVTLNRDGELLKNNEQPVLYTAYNKAVVPTDENKLVNAFQIPAAALPGDELKIYVWNQNKVLVQVKEMSLNLIELYSAK